MSGRVYGTRTQHLPGMPEGPGSTSIISKLKSDYSMTKFYNNNTKEIIKLSGSGVHGKVWREEHVSDRGEKTKREVM